MTRKGDWMQTASGRQYWPLDPRASEVDRGDIVHHLSMICRYCGACLRFYSVLEHSLGVLYVARRAALREGAHPRSVRHVSRHAARHDSPEAYCHDLIRPIKRCVHGYAEVEAANFDAIAERFGLGLVGTWAGAIIKAADNAMLLAEQAALMAPAPAKWAAIDVPQEMLDDAHAWLRAARWRPWRRWRWWQKRAFLREWERLAA